MITFLNSKLNTPVGGGQCAHVATEALRVGGAEFAPRDLGADSPNAGDSVWGTRVTVISYFAEWSDSKPRNLCQPGDVIQYGSAQIGTTIYPTQHTSVVAAVNDAGRPTSVYQQNIGDNLTMQQATIDTTELTAGWLQIYRPITRIDRSNEWKFTVVNNLSAGQMYTVMVDTTAVSTVSLGAANTAGSFRIHQVTTIGTVPNLLTSDGQSLFVETAKGNELYVSPGSSVAIRQLTQ